ncbi:MAG: hypothetical protein WBF58_09180 [Xanthobacteraceae bacterium]
MRLIIALLLLCMFAWPGHAETLWSVCYGTSYYSDGSCKSDFLTLSTNGNVREFRLDNSGRKGPLVFKLVADGTHYKGTAFLPSKRCSQVSFDVEGEVHVLPDEGESHKSNIELSGDMPRVDARCRIVSASKKVLKIEFDVCQVGLGKCSNCNCGGATAPELRPVFKEVGDPTYGEEPHILTGSQCPYLYAWSDRESRWDSYGKMIHGAENAAHERTQIVALSSLATKFRLAEEEPEISFIDDIHLIVYLRDGSEITLEPQTEDGGMAHGQIRIAPFTEVKFGFTLPSTVKQADVEKASLSITGYYEIAKPSGVAAEH